MPSARHEVSRIIGLAENSIRRMRRSWMLGSLLQKSVLAFVYRCSGAVVTFVFGVSLARMMSIEEYGVLISLMSFGSIAATVGLVGQQFQLLRELPSLAAGPHYRAITTVASRRLLVTCLGSLAVTLAAALAFVIFHGQVRVFGHWEYSTGLLLVVPLALIELQSSIGRALGSVNMALIPKDVLWRLFIMLFGGALFVASGEPLKAVYVLMTAAITLILLIAGQQLLLRRLIQGHSLFTPAAMWSTDGLGSTLRASTPFWVISVASILFSTLDVVVVSVLVGPMEAGYYYAANRIALLLDFFLSTFAIPAAPRIARLYDEGRRGDITRETSGAALLAFALVLAGLAVFALGGHWALMAFGNAFVHSFGILMVLATGCLAGSYCGLGGIVLSMTGHQAAAMRIMVLTSSLGLIAMVGATWMFGVWGTAVTAAVSVIVMKAWTAAHIYAVEGIDLTATTMARNLLVRSVRWIVA
jgi:O-antigen/teichoic acid export membrane protein